MMNKKKKLLNNLSLPEKFRILLMILVLQIVFKMAGKKEKMIFIAK